MDDIYEMRIQQLLKKMTCAYDTYYISTLVPIDQLIAILSLRSFKTATSKESTISPWPFGLREVPFFFASAPRTLFPWRLHRPLSLQIVGLCRTWSNRRDREQSQLRRSQQVAARAQKLPWPRGRWRWCWEAVRKVSDVQRRCMLFQQGLPGQLRLQVSIAKLRRNVNAERHAQSMLEKFR